MTLDMLKHLPGHELSVSRPVEEQTQTLQAEMDAFEEDFQACRGGPPSSVTPSDTLEEALQAQQEMRQSLRDFCRTSHE